MTITYNLALPSSATWILTTMLVNVSVLSSSANTTLLLHRLQTCFLFYQLKNCYPAFQRPQLWFVADYFAVFLSKTIMIRHCRLYFGIVFCSPTTILFEVDLYFASCLITDCYLDVSLSTIYMVILTCVLLKTDISLDCDCILLCCHWLINSIVIAYYQVSSRLGLSSSIIFLLAFTCWVFLQIVNLYLTLSDFASCTFLFCTTFFFML